MTEPEPSLNFQMIDIRHRISALDERLKNLTAAKPLFSRQLVDIQRRLDELEAQLRFVTTAMRRIQNRFK